VILAAGLSPVWQQILQFENFQSGEVNRATSAHWCASGKVLNTGIALHSLDADCKVLSPLGGTTGQQIQNEFDEKQISAHWVSVPEPTRVCTTILDLSTGTTTELVENSQPMSAEHLEHFATAFQEEAQSASVVAFSGSLPAGTPPSFVFDLLKSINCPVVLDIRGKELEAALPLGPLFIKPNREELSHTVGTELKTDEELISAMQELNRRGAQWTVITQGAESVWATHDREAYRFTPPLRNVVNPIGCGDCMTAGIAWATDQQLDPVTCIQIGIAAASENLTQLLPARLDPENVRSLAKTVSVEKMNS